jgi:hypothetical protein
MNRLGQLVQRRRDLQSECALQRTQLAQAASEIESQLVIADRIVRIVTFARHPVGVFALAVGAMSIGPWRLVKWTSRAALILNVAMRLRKMLVR